MPVLLFQITAIIRHNLKIFPKVEPIIFVLLLGRILRTIIYNIQHININILAQMDMLSEKMPY